MVTRDPLRDELENYEGRPDTWKPKVGDILDATVVEYDESPCCKFEPCQICTVRDRENDALLSIFVSPVVLRREFARVKPRIGERMLIKRLPDAGQAKIFRVMMDRQQPDPTVPDFGAPDADPEQDTDAPLTVENVPF